MRQILLTTGALILGMGIACAQTTGGGADNGNNNVFSGHNAGLANNNVFSGHSTTGTAGTAMNNGSNATAPGNGNSGATSGTRMSDNQIEAKLQAEGYNTFTHVRHHNGYFQANARRYGQAANNVKVSLNTGKLQSQRKLNDQQVKVLLAEKGYKGIMHVHNTQGHMIAAKARMNGTEQSVYVNSLTGNITHKS